MQVPKAGAEPPGVGCRSFHQVGQTNAPGPGRPGASRVERHFARRGWCWEGWPRGRGSRSRRRQAPAQPILS